MKLKTLIAIAALAATQVFAQQNTITTPPPAPPAVNATPVGLGGFATYYYVVVANYPSGASQSRVTAATGASPTLSGSRYNQVGWAPLTGVLTYDVLRVPTNSFSGSCTCALATGLSASTISYSDTGGGLSGYAIGAPAQAANAQWILDNTDYAFPKLRLSIGNAPGGAQANHLGEIPSGGTLPAYCTIGDIFVKTGVSSGIYACLTTNIWTFSGGGSGSTGYILYTGPNLNAACAAAVTAHATLAIASAITAVSTTTCDAAVWFLGGGSVQPASGQTITFNGPLTAANVQIFDLSMSGTVTLGYNASPIALPLWYSSGALPVTMNVPLTLSGDTQAYTDYLIKIFGSASGSTTHDAGIGEYPNINGASLTDYWDSNDQTSAHYFRIGRANSNNLGNTLFGGPGGGVNGMAQLGTRDNEPVGIWVNDAITMWIDNATPGNTLIGNPGTTGGYCPATTTSPCTVPYTLTLDGGQTSIGLNGNSGSTEEIVWLRGKVAQARDLWNGTSRVIESSFGGADLSLAAGNATVAGTITSGDNITDNGGVINVNSTSAGATVALGYSAAQFGLISFTRNGVLKARIFDSSADNLTIEHASGSADLIINASGTTITGTAIALDGNVAWNGSTETFTSAGSATYSINYASGQYGQIQFAQNGTNEGRLWDSAANALTLEHAIGSADLVLTTAGVAITGTTITLAGNTKFASTNTTAVVAGVIGTTCPAVTCTAAYTWVQAISSDGSTVFFPVWK